MKMTMKILMFVILCLFVYLSLSHLLSIDKPTIGAYWLSIFTIGLLIIFFLVFFLDLEIITKWVSIKRKMNTLENKQKQLSKIVTSLYKLSLIMFASKQNKFESKKFLDEYMQITSELEKYLDADEIDSFSDLMVKIQNEKI